MIDGSNRSLSDFISGPLHKMKFTPGTILGQKDRQIMDPRREITIIILPNRDSVKQAPNDLTLNL